MALTSTQFLTEMSTRNISWGLKTAGASGWQTYRLHVPVVQNSGTFMFVRFILFSIWTVDRDSSVGIATRYWVVGPGIESRWGRNFPQPSRPVLGFTQPPIQWETGLFSGVKAAGLWNWPPTTSIAEVKERVELQLYFFSGYSWHVIGRTLPIILPFQTNDKYCNMHNTDGRIAVMGMRLVNLSYEPNF